MGPALEGLNGPVGGELDAMSVLPGAKPTTENVCGIKKSLPASCTSWICVSIIIIYNSLPLFCQMEVYTVRMIPVLSLMMVSFNLHTKLVERFFKCLEIFAFCTP